MSLLLRADLTYSFNKVTSYSVQLIYEFIVYLDTFSFELYLSKYIISLSNDNTMSSHDMTKRVDPHTSFYSSLLRLNSLVFK